MPGDVLQIETDRHSRRQLDGERETVDATADLANELHCAIAVQRRVRPGARSFPEELHRSTRVDLGAARVGNRHRQRCESVIQLVHGPQRLATRRKHMKTREPCGELVDQMGHRRHHVLAVFEHEQEITVRQPSSERIHVRLTARPLHADLCGHLANDQVRRPQSSEPNDEHPIGKARR